MDLGRMFAPRATDGLIAFPFPPDALLRPRNRQVPAGVGRQPVDLRHLLVRQGRTLFLRFLRVTAPYAPVSSRLYPWKKSGMPAVAAPSDFPKDPVHLHAGAAQYGRNRPGPAACRRHRLDPFAV